MNAKTWAEAKSLLLEAAVLPQEARAAFLEARCVDSGVRGELLDMLANPVALSAILSSPVLSAGTALGSYVIQELRASGGMGQVYRARDTKLARDVAIKVLPADVANDPDRLRRFDREAQLLAAVNHPHVAAVHGLEEAGGLRFLVMEYVDGPSLAERIEQGPLSTGDAVRIACEIAAGLKAAHRAGVTHRDLKPANVMLGPDGAKLVDFGLAKPTARAASAVSSLTAPGLILGTLPYMAPEQVEGGATDERTDIFAFGCVLYEMLAGRRPFTGTTPSAVGAAILEREPPALSGIRSPHVEHVTMRCLAKKPDDRWQTAADLHAELTWARNPPVAADPGPHALGATGYGVGWIVAAAIMGSLGGAALLSAVRPARVSSPVPVIHATLDVAPAEELSSARGGSYWVPTPGGSRTAVALTPDGRSLVFVGRGAGVQQLYVRALDAGEARALPGTEGSQMLAVAPDGRSVAFGARGALKRIALAGGVVTELMSDLTAPPAALVCDSLGRVFFDGDGRTVWAVRPGSTAAPITTLREGEIAHIPSAVLPGDRVLLYTVRRRTWTWGDEQVVAMDLATGRSTVLVNDAADARYVSSGHLVFLRRGTLMAVPFDPSRLLPAPAAASVVEGVAQALAGGHTLDVTGAGQFSVSASGSLAWIAAGPVDQGNALPVSVDRSGRIAALGLPVRTYGPVARISPDGRRLAVTIVRMGDVGLWVYDLAREILTPLVRTGEVSWPMWSRDGRRLVFNWLHEGRFSIAAQPSDASTPPTPVASGDFMPSSWTADNRIIGLLGDQIAVESAGAVTPFEPARLTGETERWPELSSDGRWLAFASGASGRLDVYVEPYPGPGPRTPVSNDGGSSPGWSPNGREIFYVRSDGPRQSRMLAVDFTPGPTPRVGRPRTLFEFDPLDLAFACAPLRCYDVAADGRRFFVLRYTPVPAPRVTQVHFIENWIEELKARVPAR